MMMVMMREKDNYYKINITFKHAHYFDNLKTEIHNIKKQNLTLNELQAIMLIKKERLTSRRRQMQFRS